MENSDTLRLKRFGYSSLIEESKNNELVRMKNE
jgi:hypothetical protein